LDDTGYEFIHKSFGEYLIARALLVAARRAEDRLDNTNEEDTAKEWLQTAGSAELTNEILRFLRDEVRRLPLNEAKNLKDALQGLMSWTLRSGMPAQALEGVFSFREIEARQRHAEGGLLAVLNACARRISEQDRGAAIIMLDWPDDHAMRRMIERLYIPVFSTSPMSGCLSYLSSERIDCFLHCLDLFRADLEEAKLDGANLWRADLWSANLRRASLRKAHLMQANLAEALLERANLEGAHLEGANLGLANLQEAHLGGANLGGANLEEALLERANLQGANLERANLQGANLQGANLEGANLEGTSLYQANLGGIDLTGAAGLAQEQIDVAYGDARTMLPGELKTPPAWLEDRDGE
jgi:uncharacterized protein YjbI with pentapeptide repeats